MKDTRSKISYPVKKKKKVSFQKQMQKVQNPKSPRVTYIQVTWVNSQGNQCKKIIQPNRCFCSHSFQHHQNPKTIGSAFCLSPGCSCKCYQYVPYYDLKCMCRHSYKEHDRNSKMCKMCNKCLGFLTNWSCKCGQKYQLHQTVFQIVKTNPKSERNNMSTITKGKNSLMDISNLQQSPFNTENKHSHSFDDQKDARTYEITKYQVQLNHYSQNERKLEQSRKRLIQRINQKYSNIDFQKQIRIKDQMQVSKIYRPDNARKITPLELFIRPHNYHPIKLEKFLQKVYKKYDNRISQRE